MNDQARATYTDEVLLAYLNIARSELQEIYELNDIPATHKTSSIISVPIGETRVAFTGTVAQLPVDLVEINKLWESDEGQDVWSPVIRQDYLTNWIPANNAPVSKFGVWAWQDQEIKLLPSLQVNDLKIDYLASLFFELDINSIQQRVNIRSIDTTLEFRVAGLAAEFIEENFTRANSMNNLAGTALTRALGISIKGQQAIATRRRPFRAAFKARRWVS